MAYTIGTVRGEFESSVIDGSNIGTVKAAIGDNPVAAAVVSGRATFKVQATGDTSDATALLSLTDKGVIVPAGHARMVTARAYCRDDDQGVVVENRFMLIGGTNTPSVAAATAANTTILAGGFGTSTTPTNPVLTMGVNTTPSPDEVEVRIALSSPGTGADVNIELEVTVDPLVVLAAGASTTS